MSGSKGQKKFSVVISSVLTLGSILLSSPSSVSLLKGETSGVLGDRALVRPNATTFSDGAAGI